MLGGQKNEFIVLKRKGALTFKRLDEALPHMTFFFSKPL